MNDNQKRLVETLSRFPDQTSVALAKTAMLLLFSDLIDDGRDRPILNSVTYDLPDGSLSFTRDDFEEAFLNTLSQNPETENFGIGPETYAYVSKLSDSFTNQTPTPEFTETTSTTPDKIRLEELEEFKEKGQSTLTESMDKENQRIKDWEKKQKEINTVFVAPTPEFKPREINLSPKEQEELQVIKNVFNKEGEDNFRKDVEEKVKKEIATRLTPPEISEEEITTSANITAVSLTEIVSSLPDEIPTTIFVEDTTTPLMALTTSEITASIAGVNEFASDAVSVSKQVNSLLENTSSMVAPVLGSFYTHTENANPENFQVSEKPTSKDVVKVEIQKLQEYAQIKNMIWEKAREMGATPSEADIEKLTTRLRGQTRAYQYVTHAAKGLWGNKDKKTSSDWGGLNIIQNNATNLLKSKYGLSVKIGGEGTDKALQIMIGNRNLTAIGGKVSQLATKISSKIPSQAAFKAGVSKAVTTGITKLSAKLGIQALAQALGSMAPVIGNIIAWIASEIVWKVGVWIKRHWKGFLQALGIGALGGAALVGGTAGLGLGALGGGALIASVGGVGAVGAVAHTGLSLFLYTVSNTLLTISKTVLAMIVVTPVLVALILFIINNGAYMVPPSSETGGGGIAVSCFVLIDEASWPQDKKDNLTNAINKLVADHPPFVNKICAKGEVLLHYDSFDPGYWGHYDGTNNITLYPGGLTNQLDAEYILSHESSHLMAAYSASYTYVEYLDYPGIDSEPTISTYFSCAGTSDRSETFAESIALYASEKPFICLPGGLKSNYPIHWQFCDETIFN